MFLCGASALTFEVVWTRRFVVLFGNSSHAISTVLCAFMAGLGVGALLGGRLADRTRYRLLAFGVSRAGVAAWALGIPAALQALLVVAAHSPLLASDSFVLTTLIRFAIASALMFVPCVLMGASLPLLVRHCADSAAVVGHRTASLYGLNTLGGAVGCLAAGYWMVDTLGLFWSNLLAVAANAVVVVCVLPLIGRRRAEAEAPRDSEAEPAPLPVAEGPPASRGRVLLLVAFAASTAGLSAEVLWVRYLAFFSNVAYTFTSILFVYLVGLGLGGLAYRALLAGTRDKLRLLAGVELLLGLSVAASFIGGGFFFCSLPPGSLPLMVRAAIVGGLPTLLMGVAFPLLCAAYSDRLAHAGRSVGAVYFAGTLGSVTGSVLPAFVLIPAVGVQNSVLICAFLYCAAGCVVLGVAGRRRAALGIAGAAAAACVVAAVALSTMGGLCRRTFLASGFDTGRQSEIVYFSEGSTATAILTEDRINGVQHLLINSSGEVDVTYSGMSCFKLLGALGPLLHPNPERVLSVAIGAGISAGTVIQFEEVDTLVAVDLERSIVEAARSLPEENNGLFSSPKLKVVIDDGRNYLLRAQPGWSVVVCDSTHPKSSDSWVLYTQEFYRTVRDALAPDGVLVQWLPIHDLSVSEMKIICRTFQSVFPHTSLWFSHGYNEMGQYVGFTLLVGTPEPLRIALDSLQAKLAQPAVADDLGRWDMSRPVEILENFLCGEAALRAWVGPGPVNTDDLPYTQYRTAYSSGRPCTMAALSVPMESVVPYLAGMEGRADGVAEDLSERMAANRLLFSGHVSEALAVMPDNPRLRQNRENALAGVGYTRQVAGLYPDDPAALAYWAAIALSMVDGEATAVDLCRRALALRPDDAGLHSRLGFALVRAGLPGDAINACRRAIELAPDAAAAHNNLGLALLAEGDTDGATAEFRQAVAADPRDPRLRVSLGLALAAKRDYAGAIAALSGALAVDPDFFPALYNMGTALATQGRMPEAEAAFRRAIDAAPEVPAGHRALGQVLMQMNRPQEALPHLQRARVLLPDRTSAGAAVLEMQ
jgi:spermidine synthase